MSSKSNAYREWAADQIHVNNWDLLTCIQKNSKQMLLYWAKYLTLSSRIVLLGIFKWLLRFIYKRVSGRKNGQKSNFPNWATLGIIEDRKYS